MNNLLTIAIVACLCASSALASPAPTLAKNGMYENQPGFISADPGDTHGAMSMGWIVQKVNKGITFTNRVTGATNLESDDAFWGIPRASSEGDGRVLFNPLANRWIAVERTLEPNIGIRLGVSKTSDPAAGWWSTFYPTEGGTLADYPQVGFNTNWIVVTIQYWTAGNGPGLLVIPKAAAYAGQVPFPVALRKSGLTLQCPAETYDPHEQFLYLVSDDGVSRASGSIIVSRIAGTPTAPLYEQDVATPSSGMPYLDFDPNSTTPQPNSSAVVANGLKGTRFNSCVESGGSLYCSQTAAVKSPPHFISYTNVEAECAVAGGPCTVSSPIPTSVQPGDVIFAVIVPSGYVSSPTVPSGWKIEGGPFTASDQYGCVLSVLIAAHTYGAEGGTYDFGNTMAPSCGYATELGATLVAYRGAVPLAGKDPYSGAIKSWVSTVDQSIIEAVANSQPQVESVNVFLASDQELSTPPDEGPATLSIPSGDPGDPALAVHSPLSFPRGYAPPFMVADVWTGAGGAIGPYKIQQFVNGSPFNTPVASVSIPVPPADGWTVQYWKLGIDANLAAKPVFFRYGAGPGGVDDNATDPAIGVNALGDVLLSYSIVSATHYYSTQYALWPQGTTAPEPPYLGGVLVGTEEYTGARTGDYGHAGSDGTELWLFGGKAGPGGVWQEIYATITNIP